MIWAILVNTHRHRQIFTSSISSAELSIVDLIFDIFKNFFLRPGFIISSAYATIGAQKRSKGHENWLVTEGKQFKFLRSKSIHFNNDSAIFDK